MTKHQKFASLTVFVFGCPDQDVHADGVALDIQLEPVDVVHSGLAGGRLLLLPLRGFVVARLEVILTAEKEVLDEAMDLLDVLGREVLAVLDQLPEHGDHDQVEGLAEGLVGEGAEAARHEHVQGQLVQEVQQLRVQNQANQIVDNLRKRKE